MPDSTFNDHHLLCRQLSNGASKIACVMSGTFLEERYEVYLNEGINAEEGEQSKLETYLHVHLRNRIILEVLVVAVIQDVVIVKGHPFRSQHIGQERKFFLFETLM